MVAVKTPPLTIYSAKICPWAQRATLALEEVGADVKHVEIDLKNKPSWYASKVNPASKVPVLQVGEEGEKSTVFVPESHVVMELIGDLYQDSDKGITPKDPIEKAEARYFVERYNQVVSGPFMALLLHGKEDQAPVLLAGIKEIQTLLSRHPGPFLLGDKITIGDIGVAPFVGRLFSSGKAGLIPGNVCQTLKTGDEYKVFVDYAEALMSRPSFKATFDEDYIVAFTRDRIASSRGAAAAPSPAAAK